MILYIKGINVINFYIENYLNEFLRNMNINLGPPPIVILKYMHMLED